MNRRTFVQACIASLVGMHACGLFKNKTNNQQKYAAYTIPGCTKIPMECIIGPIYETTFDNNGDIIGHRIIND